MTRKPPKEDTKKLLMLIELAKLLADGLGRSTSSSCKVSSILFIPLALKLYGKDWKKVEDFIGTRTGAQIRSHA
jgi:hypothetical protein